MAKKKAFVNYTVVITRYKDDEQRERFEQSSPRVSDFSDLVPEFVYSGSSEASARGAFFSASRRSQKDEMVRSIAVWADGQLLIRTRPV